MQKYLLFIVIIIVVIALILFLILSKFGKFPSSTINQSTNIPSPIVQNLNVVSVIPTDGSVRASIFQEVQISFDRPVNDQEQSSIKLNPSPLFKFEQRWLEDQKTVSMTPTEPLSPDTKYTLIISYLGGSYSWGFTTISKSELSPEDVYKNQLEADKNFGDWQANIYNNYPWYDKFPLSSDNYFVYFDLNDKQFVAKIYSKTSNKTLNDSQIEDLKNEIGTKIKAAGVDLTVYKIQWVIK